MAPGSGSFRQKERAAPGSGSGSPNPDSALQFFFLQNQKHQYSVDILIQNWGTLRDNSLQLQRYGVKHTRNHKQNFILWDKKDSVVILRFSTNSAGVVF